MGPPNKTKKFNDEQGGAAGGGEGEEEKPYTGVGRYGTAPPLTSHGGRSRVAERKGGKTVQDAVTSACHALVQKFMGNPEFMKEESDVPRLVRAENGGIGKDIPDAVIMNRFRNIISCSSKLPPLLNKKERRHLKRKAEAEARERESGGGGAKKKK